MNHHIRVLACGAAMATALIACGGKQTMASKSAAAYDEAKKKGIAVGAGEHGGHSAAGAAERPSEAASTVGHGAMPGMDHSAMAGMDHSKMDHSNMPGMEHGSKGGAAHDMAGMEHSNMPGMQHGSAGVAAHDMPGMDHSAMAGMDHSKMPGMQHGSSATAPIVIAPPTSNAAIARTQPAATLRPDDFDAPAPSAIDEAAKASHEHRSPPTHHHGNGEAP